MQLCVTFLWQKRASGIVLLHSWQQLCGLRFSILVCPQHALQFLRLDMTPLYVCFLSVFVSQLWAALVSLAELELSVHQASWHPKLLHSDDMPHPTKLSLDEYGLNAGGVGTLQVLQVGDVVLIFPSWRC